MQQTIIMQQLKSTILPNSSDSFMSKLKSTSLLLLSIMLSSCASFSQPPNAKNPATFAQYQTKVQVPPTMPAINYQSAIYEVAVQEGVSYNDVIDSLKSISQGQNFVNPANFPIGEHMQLRGQPPVGILEVRAFCNLSLGAEIMQDHPEFVVFAPCRIAIYEKLVVENQADSNKGAHHKNQKRQLYLALDRPTFDLQSIQNPTPRAIKAAVALETQLIDMLDKVRKGDF
jgi:uncharacterized protein (DUF302 family)